jgi:hypothetical protein
MIPCRISFIPRQLDGAPPGRAIEATEVRVIQERAAGAIISRGCFGIHNRQTLRVESLHLVGAVLVRPHPIGILAEKMVVFTRMDDHGDFAGSTGTACLERGATKVRNIRTHQSLNRGAGTPCCRAELRRDMLRSTGLVVHQLTTTGLSSTLCQLCGV